jgi:ADP-heptose:LPS heptosyltransferase
MRLYVADSNAQWWCQQRQQHDLSDRNYAVLAPTSRWLSKRWPILRWGALIEPLRVLGLNRCVVIGAPGERDQVQALLGGPAGAGSNSHESVVDLVGCATVGQTMAVIAGSSLLIANDSAPLHMAVGLDIPCVGLFGPTNPDEVGPYEKSDSVIRCVDAPLSSAAHFKNRTLGDALMQRITAEAVVDRARAVLNDASTKRSEV